MFKKIRDWWRFRRNPFRQRIVELEKDVKWLMVDAESILPFAEDSLLGSFQQAQAELLELKGKLDQARVQALAIYSPEGLVNFASCSGILQRDDELRELENQLDSARQALQRLTKVIYQPAVVV